jgi:hypothetical protein
MVILFDSRQHGHRVGNACGGASGPALREPPRLSDAYSLLRLRRSESDTVRIILAAQIQLRRWRRGDSKDLPQDKEQRVRAIVAARELLIQRAVQRKRLASG